MRNKDWAVLCITTIAAAMLALAGCNEPNRSPTTDKNSPPPATSAAGHAGVAISAVSSYTPAKKLVPLTSCNLERVDGATFGAEALEHPVGKVHSFSGWIAAPQLDKPAYELRFDDKQANHYFQAPVHPSIARSDVTAISGNEAFSPDSGFKLDVAAGALPDGRYHVYLVALTGDVVHSCDNGRQVLLGN